MIGIILAVLLVLLLTSAAVFGWHKNVFGSGGDGLRAKTILLDDPIKHPGWDRMVRLAFIAMGPVALLTLTLSYMELVPMRISIYVLTIPVHLIMITLGWFFPRLGKRALTGWLCGILATVLYEVVRIATTYAANGPDFVAFMGVEVGGEGTPAFVGYIWRLLGNGAGLGLVYAMLPEKFFHNLRGGLIYGTFVSFFMLGTLYFFPVTQFHLVILTAQAVINGLLGHWAYGLSLGWIYPRVNAQMDHTPGKHVLLDD